MTRSHLPVITNSELRTQRRCARERHLAYGLGYRSVHVADVLRFGTLTHVGLEAWWRAPDDRRLLDALQAMAPLAADAFEAVRAAALLQGYDARWADEPLVALAVEQEFRAPLINPETGAASRTYELAGKLDVIVRDLRDGLVYIVEHKTTTEDVGAGSAYWKRLQLDSQVSTYYAGGKSLGYDVAGCIYDVLVRPGLRPLKATPTESRKFTREGRLYANQRDADETPDAYMLRLVEAIARDPDRYYQRGTVVRLEAEERDHAFDVWQTARLMREAEVAQRFPRNPEACVRYGRECTYFPVCTGTASLDDATLYRRAERTHEELSPEIEAA